MNKKVFCFFFFNGLAVVKNIFFIQKMLIIFVLKCSYKNNNCSKIFKGIDMKKYLSLIAVSVLALGVNNANAAGAKAEGKALAEILSPMGITHGADVLNFGKMLTGSYTVTVDTAGNATFSDTTKRITSTTSADKFVINTSSNMQFTLNVPTSITLKGKTNTSKTMTVDNIKVKLGNGSDVSAGSNITGTLASGDMDVWVGGTLNVTSDAPVDQYEGTYEVLLSY